MKTYLEPAEIDLLEKEATNLRDRILLRTLYHLGCRVSEALAIKVEDIDFKQGTVTILHLKSRINLSCPNCGGRLAAIHTYCPKCGKKVRQTQKKEQEYHRQRVLPIERDTLQLLREYINRGGPVLREGKAFIFGINRHRAW